MNFEVTKKDFLKDGKPIKIISGAVHYFRNMPDTWRDIFKKLRAIEPLIFNFYGPSCFVSACPEGRMTCGRAAEIKEKFSNLK